MTSFQEFAHLCQRISQVSGSLEKVDILASFLANLEGRELEVVANFVMGKVFPQSDMELGVGPSILYDALSRAMGFRQDAMAEILRATGDPGLVAAQLAEKKKPLSLAAFMESDQLSIMDVYHRFQAVSRASGKGSQDAKVKNLQFLFSESTPLEALYLARLAMEDLRIGVGEGLVRDAIAKAFGQPVDLVERGYNLTNDLGLTASHARLGSLEELGLALNRPIKMMLAQIGESIESSLKEGATAIEWKFDGARVQVHKDGDAVRVFSRRLEDVTASLPEIVAVVHSHIRARTAILDGEAVAVGEDGRPRPFQDILRRFRRKYHVTSKAAEIPLNLNLFDIVYLDGETLLDRPLEERRRLLLQAADEEIVAQQLVSSDPEVVRTVYNQSLAAGHEGVMLKNPASVYAPGKRGKNWLKIKPVMEALDLVVVGARWGEGKRAQQLGSYRLACLDSNTGKLADVGWVATGLTDEMLGELTEMFRDLIVVQTSVMEVEITPHVVFEVGYEEIQRSPNYTSGYALRFPRLIAVRDDKSPGEADTLERIGEIYRLQRGRSAF